MAGASAITFSVEQGRARYRGAVYKLAGADYYAWSWSDNIGGPTYYVDLLDGGTGALRNTSDVHFASHASGETHRRLIGANITTSQPARITISRIRRQPPTSVPTWLAINQITIPLEPLPQAMQDPLRGKVYRRSIVLRKADFDNVGGINLVSYWCRRRYLQTLRRRKPHLRSWTLGQDDLLIVIFAEPIRALNPVVA